MKEVLNQLFLLALVASLGLAGCATEPEFNCKNGEHSADYQESLAIEWQRSSCPLAIQSDGGHVTSAPVTFTVSPDDSVRVVMDLRGKSLFKPIPVPSSRLWIFDTLLILDLYVTSKATIRPAGASIDCLSDPERIEIKSIEVAVPKGVSASLVR